MKNIGEGQKYELAYKIAIGMREKGEVRRRGVTCDNGKNIHSIIFP